MTPPQPTRLIDYLTLARDHLAKRGIDNSRLDAELLLAEALGLSRVELYTKHDRPLAKDEVDRFRALLRRRAAREPVAYITGRREFWSLEFRVDRRVLIPRPETETLVEAALEAARGDSDRANGGPRVLDLGTGSGAVAVALAVELPSARLVATDRSAAVLEVAPENARRHGVDDRIEFRHGDLFDPIGDEERFELIVSNPPYCKDGELDGLEPEVRDWEPSGALAAGADGMDVTNRIIAGAGQRLAPEGWLLLEVGTQADEARAALQAQGWREIRTVSDLAGRERVVSAQRPVG